VISREDAFLLLDKLCACRRVRCRVSFASFGLWIEGKLRRDGDFVFLESPGFALDIRLTEDVGFEYVEPRDALGQALAGSAILSGLGIALPLRVPVPLVGPIPPPRDKIFLFELAED
jgi:hypothetical protein